MIDFVGLIKYEIHVKIRLSEVKLSELVEISLELPDALGLHLQCVTIEF